MTFGTMKMFDVPPMPAGMPPFGLTSQIGIAGVLEVFGGLAIVIGLFTAERVAIQSRQVARNRGGHWYEREA